MHDKIADCAIDYKFPERITVKSVNNLIQIYKCIYFKPRHKNYNN